MLYMLENTEKVKKLFEGWEDTMITSCLQKCMGNIYVSDPEKPESALAIAGCFGFLAGKPDRTLITERPEGFVILTPQNKEWDVLIKECCPNAQKRIRYAIKKDTVFDRVKLKNMVKELPDEYILCRMDGELYDKCAASAVFGDFVSAFRDKEEYLRIGRGIVILKDGEIVSGASSYTRYNEGIEIEVDTLRCERRKHLAQTACAALILLCLDEGLYPSWDAHNMNSVRLAEKLGYEPDHEYTVYEIE